jgi:7-keto-8-aminopelargonate synthetase-like enzyme
MTPETVNIAGNDYLGLSEHPKVIEATCQAARQHGVSATSGRWALGWTEYHQRLEERLTKFFDAEDLCLHGSGYLGGLAFFAAMKKEYSTVFCDEFVHSSVIAGMRTSNFEINTWRHLDINDLARQLEAYDGPPPIITTDGLFGISGEFSDLQRIAELARQKKALVFSDDSHALFSVGTNGRGSLQLFGLASNDLVVTGSLSKGLGCYGGCTFGRTEIINRVRRAVGYVGSTPMPLPIVGACHGAMDLLEKDQQLLNKLRTNHQQMSDILKARGITVISHPAAPILTMQLADKEEAIELAEHLTASGLRTKHLNYPSEPRENLLRTVARACYDQEILQRFDSALGSFNFHHH